MCILCTWLNQQESNTQLLEALPKQHRRCCDGERFCQGWGTPKWQCLMWKKKNHGIFLGLRGTIWYHDFLTHPHWSHQWQTCTRWDCFEKLVSGSGDYNNCNCWSSSNRSWWTRRAWRTIDFSSFDLSSSSLTGFSRHCTLRLQDPHHTWGVVHK